MKRRVAMAAAAFAVLLATPAATAQILPPPPAIPAPPAELKPLLELLSGPGGLVTEPGCAALGTVLGLGALVIPGLPGTIEAQTGLSLAGLPIDLQPELLSLVNTLLFVQGSGCGLLPLAAERTVCAPDDALSAALEARSFLNLPGLPVQLGDFVPVPAPTAGSVVDMFRTLARLNVPGAAEVVAAMNAVGDCELRTRFRNVEPPPIPSGAKLSPPAAVTEPLRQPRVLLVEPPASLGPAVALGDQIASAPDRASVAAADAEGLPRWLQAAAVLLLVVFLYRAIAPARVS